MLKVPAEDPHHFLWMNEVQCQPSDNFLSHLAHDFAKSTTNVAPSSISLVLMSYFSISNTTPPRCPLVASRMIFLLVFHSCTTDALVHFRQYVTYHPTSFFCEIQMKLRVKPIRFHLCRRFVASDCSSSFNPHWRQHLRFYFAILEFSTASVSDSALCYNLPLLAPLRPLFFGSAYSNTSPSICVPPLHRVSLVILC